MIDNIGSLSNILKAYNGAIRELVTVVENNAQMGKSTVDGLVILDIVNRCMEDVNKTTETFLMQALADIDG